MSFYARLVHDLTIIRNAYGGTDDDYGQPELTATTTAVRGLVQPRTGDEAPDTRSAGAGVSDHVVFLPITTDIQGSDSIIWHRPDRENPRLEVTNVRAFEFGSTPHLEVDCRAVSTSLVGAGS